MVLSSDDYFQNQFFFEKIFQEYHQSVKHLDPDQARRFVGPDLGPNCLQKIVGKVLTKLFTYKHFC